MGEKLKHGYIKLLVALCFSILFMGANIYGIDKIIGSSYLGLFVSFVLIYVTVSAIVLLRNRFTKICDIALGITIGAALFSSSYVRMDTISKLALLLTVSYACYKVIPFAVRKDYKKLIPTKPKRFILALLILYATFASTYNQIVTNTVPINFTFVTICYILLFCVFWFMLSLCLLLIFEKWQAKIKIATISPLRNTRAKLWVVVFIIITTCYSFWLIACFPVNTMWDGVFSWWQSTIIGRSPIVSEHPAMYALLIGFCRTFVNSPFLVVLLQTFVQAMLWASIAVFFFNKGLPRKYIYLMAFFVGLMPNNGINTATMLKDIVFAVAMLALMFILAEIISNSEKDLPLFKSFVLIAALFFTCFFRNEGFVAVIPTIAILIIFYFRKRVILASSVITLLLITFTQFIVFPALKVEPYVPGKYAAILHAVGSIFYYDGSMSNEAEKFFTQNVPKNEWKSDFRAYYWDSYVVPNVYTNSKDAKSVLEATVPQFQKAGLKAYEESVKALVSNPIIAARNFFDISETQWAVFQGADPTSYNVPYIFGIQSSLHNYFPVFIARSESNSLTNVAKTILVASEKITIVQILLWRGGIYIILFFILVYYAWIRGRPHIALIFIPLFFRFGFLLFFSVAQAYRYAYPAFLVFPFALLFVLIEIKQHQNNESDKRTPNLLLDH